MALQVNLIQSQKLHSPQTRNRHLLLHPREEEAERLDSVFQWVFGNRKTWTLGAQAMVNAVVTLMEAGAIAAVVLARTRSHHRHLRQSLNPKLGTQLHRQRQQ